MSAPVFCREWGAGLPVLALHPLGLDSSGFEGFGRVLAGRGFRTIAIDLPGFGRSPAPDAPLRPDVLAAPVVEIARTLGEPPLVLGISLGGRVALEAVAQLVDELLPGREAAPARGGDVRRLGRASLVERPCLAAGATGLLPARPAEGESNA
jgi:pimeloyl-ACP methyl ester carboxylesterase